MMAPGDEKIVAQRIHRGAVGRSTRSSRSRRRRRRRPTCPAAGRSRFSYAASNTTHTLHLQQNGNRLEGTHQGNFLTRDIAGTINGDTVTLASNVDRAPRRLADLPLQRQSQRRHDVGHARHGRVSHCDLDGAQALARVNMSTPNLQLPTPKESRSYHLGERRPALPVYGASTPMCRAILFGS